MFESNEAEDIAFLKMWKDMVNGMMNDFLQGIVRAVANTPKNELTAEKIMRTGVGYSVKRFVASDPPKEEISPFEASKYFLEKHFGDCTDKWSKKIFQEHWVTLEKVNDEILINWKPHVCSFQAHCLALKKKNLCMCVRRLYHEELIREMAQKNYQSKLELCDPAGTGCCFKLFPKI